MAKAHPTLHSVDEANLDGTVDWACNRMGLWTDWTRTQSIIGQGLLEKFELEMRLQLAKVHFFFELTEVERLVYLISEIEMHPAVYGEWDQWLRNVGGDVGY